MLATRRSQTLCRSCRTDLFDLFRNGFVERPSYPRSFRQARSLASHSLPYPLRYKSTRRALHSTVHLRSEPEPEVKTTSAKEPSALSDVASDGRSPGEPHGQVDAKAQAVPGRETSLDTDSEVGQEPGEGLETDDIQDESLEALEEVLDPDLDSDEDTIFHDPVAEARSGGRGIEAIVRAAKQTHGEYLPADTLSEEELLRYVRLYGEPLEKDELESVADEDDVDVEEREPHTLYRDSPDGSLEPVEYEPLDEDAELDQDPALAEILDESPTGFQPGHMDAKDLSDRAEKTAQIPTNETYFDEDGNQVAEEELERARMHPLTREGTFSEGMKTIFLPQDSFNAPITKMLSDFSNKHIDEAALRLLGGPGLPAGVSTPISRRTDMQVPISLTTTQHTMSQMDANVFVSALWPGMYASVLSVLVEVRKRLGTNWLRKLMSKKGGPRILDAGSGGAAVIAWREIVKAEWETMYPGEPLGNASMGQATVLTGSDSLRHRAAALLENTTFVPRLPDYVHVRDAPTLEDDRAPPERKQYDIILAPHTLWQLKEEFMRKQQVQNYWSLLSPDGGVLMLLEKGVPRGFEVIGGAREMILDKLIASPGSEVVENELQAPGDNQFSRKGPGMIIAPCTNHKQCPMYTTQGISRGRKDLCAFEQRYVRPHYLQRILKAKHRNHEDLCFSYLAVRKGIDDRPTQGKDAVDAAFKGYGGIGSAGEGVNMLSLPRLVYPSLKRRGHVILDVCTPEGKAERWTVPRSIGRQAHRDARKSSRGDLWALGAKTRIPRNIRLGTKKVQTKQERLQEYQDEQEERLEDLKLKQEMRASQGADLDELLGGAPSKRDYTERRLAALEEDDEYDDIDDEELAALEDGEDLDGDGDDAELIAALEKGLLENDPLEEAIGRNPNGNSSLTRKSAEPKERRPKYQPLDDKPEDRERDVLENSYPPPRTSASAQKQPDTPDLRHNSEFAFGPEAARPGSYETAAEEANWRAWNAEYDSQKIPGARATSRAAKVQKKERIQGSENEKVRVRQRTEKAANFLNSLKARDRPGFAKEDPMRAAGSGNDDSSGTSRHWPSDLEEGPETKRT